jgi:TolB-like protein/DNA-binding winged helix-turn-helix (wHTH) protein
MALETRPSGIVQFGTFEADLRSGELRKQGKRIKIQEQPFHVLTVLLRHPGEVVTREELRNQNWPPDTFVDFDNSLNTAINKLRDALGDSADSPRFIETLPRRGYRFIAPVLGDQQSELPVPAEESKRVGRQPGIKPQNRLWLVAAAVTMILLLAPAYIVLRSRTKDVAHSKINSLAVLPLKNLSADPAQEYLADGMTEELIGRLAGIHDLRVVSRTSVMRFKDAQLSVPEIARTLHVDAVVEGSVIREGSRIRIHAQLIRGATDEHFWSEAYDRDLRDVLGLQSEVAESIALKVRATVTGEERTRLTAARPVSPEVYESYLKGLYVLSQ